MELSKVVETESESRSYGAGAFRALILNIKLNA